MSRIAKKPIVLPKGVEVKIDGQVITVKGPKGEMQYTVNELIDITLIDKNQLNIAQKEDKFKTVRKNAKNEKFSNAISGTERAKISNLVQGVAEGFEKKLLLIGVGYRAQMQGKKLNLSLGFSHPVTFTIPDRIKIEVPIPTEIIIRGIDRQLVGQVAADIYNIRPVEPYKGKGVRYSDQLVILKETKKK